MKIVILPSLWWSKIDAQAEKEATPPGDFPRRMMRWLEADGHEIKVIEPTEGWLNPYPNQSFLRGLDPLRAVKAVAGAARDADIVVSTFEAGAVGLLALRHLAFFKPKIALWEFNPDPDWAVRTRIQHFITPKLDLVMALDETQREYLEKLDKPPRRIEVIGAHVDEEFYSPAPEMRRPRRVLAVGNDVGRDFETFFSAVDGMDAEVVVVSQIIAGPTPANVEIVADYVPFPAFRDHYRSADVVAVPLKPALHPGGVSTVTEAMACGSAVVVSESPGIQSFVRHGETAHVVPAGNPAALRAGIELVLNDAAYAERLRRNARAEMTGRLSQRAFAKRFEDALQKAVND